jgi:hypothetical protein
MNDRQSKRNLRILIIKFSCAALMLILVIYVITFGWFTDGNKSMGGGMTNQAAGIPYKIASVGSDGVYDEYYVREILTDSGETENQQILNQSDNTTQFYVYGDESTETLTGYISDGDNTIWEMTGKSNLNNSDSSEISPGTWGYIDFYVIPENTGNINISCELELDVFCPYDDDDNETQSDKIIHNDVEYYESENYLKQLMIGHVMFFTSVTEEDANGNDVTELKWISPDSDGKLCFNVNLDITNDYTADSESEDIEKYMAVRQRIYWVWTNIIGQAIFDSDILSAIEGNYKNVPQILSSMMSDNEKKSISISDDIVSGDFQQLLSDKSNYFFLDADIDSITKSKGGVFTENNSDFVSDDYFVLKQAWNNADQTIGNNVGYITLELVTHDMNVT